MQYIDKAVLLEEIEKRRDKNARNKLNLAAAFEDNYLLSFLNTIDVKKDVDLKEDVDRILYENDWDYDEIDFYEFAKHFFELGLTQVIDLNISRTLIVYENKLYEANWIPRGCKDKCENCPINSQCASEDMSLCEQYGLNPKDMHISKELT